MRLSFRSFDRLLMTAGALCVASGAWAQEARITFPQEGQDVRGEITARFEGIPEGGYAVVKIDGQFRTATADNAFTINTFPPNFPADGPHKLTITTMNTGGKQVGQSEVTFNIANSKVDPTAPGVRLLHWTNRDRIDENVRRFRIFAESNATVEGGAAAGGAGGASAGGGSGGYGGSGGSSGGSSGGRGGSSSGRGGSSGGSSGGGEAGGGGAATDAPLDFQVSALVRRIVRDVAMVDGSANIRSVVDRAFQRQRKTEEGGVEPPPGEKPPWSKEWEQAPETGQYFVKMIMPTGEEINATRKAPTIALGDLLPTFPQGEVRPGSTWDTRMTFVAELSERSPLNVASQITFTAFETLATPAGKQIRCAKLESRFRLPEQQAIEVAKKLAAKSGGAGGAGSGGEGGSGAPGLAGGDGGAAAAEVEVKAARTNMNRVLWFDIANRQVIRSEDIIDTYFEQEGGAAGGAEGGPGAPPSFGGSGGFGGEGAGAAPAEPTKVSYNLRVTTWLDDTIPPPTDKHNGGIGTAHSRDSVQDPPVSRVLRP